MQVTVFHIDANKACDINFINIISFLIMLPDIDVCFIMKQQHYLYIFNYLAFLFF